MKDQIYSRSSVKALLVLTASLASAVTAGAHNLYVATDNNILEIAPDGSKKVFATGTSGITAEVFDSSGNLYAANGHDHAVYKFDSHGHKTTYATIGQNYPLGMAFDASGNLYIAEVTTKDILKIKPDRSSSILTTFSNAPYGIAVDASGNILTSVQTDNIIYQISPGGAKGIYANMAYPEAIALDGSGNLFVNVSGGLVEITPAGGVITNNNYAPGQYGLLALDSLGNAFVPYNYYQFGPDPMAPAQEVCGVAKYGPGGVLTFADTAAYGAPEALAFGPASSLSPDSTTPEPSSVALLTSSLVSAARIWRKRKAKLAKI